MLDYETVVSNKRIGFQYSNQTEYISKADFVSQEAWLRFSRYNILKTRQVRKHCLQKCRMMKKLDKMKKFISLLEQKEAYAVAEFLEVNK